MKFSDYVKIGLVAGLTASPVYSQENKFKDYKDGDSVVMIHEETADTTRVEDNFLNDYLIQRGGAKSIVSTPRTDTLYVEKKVIVKRKPKSLESKTKTAWYNNKWFKILAPTLIISGAYAIYNHNNKSDEKNEEVKGIYGGRTDIGSDMGGVRGSRDDGSDAGGNR